MKKVLTIVLVIALGIMVLSNLDQIIGLAINLVILYFAFRQFLKSTSVFGKLLWGIIGLFALGAGLSNFPAIVGVLAIGLLYVVYKEWKQHKAESFTNHQDPFTNFEKQWDQLNKY